MDERQVSVVIPVIRPVGAKKCIAALGADLSFRNYEIVTEEDKERIGCPKMVKKLVARTKYDWVMFLADDTIPQPGMIMNAFETTEKLPDKWGMVGLNDGYPKAEQWACHWMAHKKLLPLLDGEFFYTGYRHSFCDCELLERCKGLGRYVFAEKAKLIHNNPLLKGQELDPDYARIYSQVFHRRDLVLFRKRQRSNWK